MRNVCNVQCAMCSVQCALIFEKIAHCTLNERGV